MHHRYFYLLLLPAAAFVIVVGVGFWKQEQLKKSSPDPTKQEVVAVDGDQPYLYPDVQESPDSPEAQRRLLDQALMNFRAAKAFRATVTNTDSEGSTTGKIEYVKPLRLHATLSMPGSQEFDMIAIGQTVYLKQDKTSWGMVRDESARNFAEEFFTSVLKSEPTLASFGVPDGAPLEIEKDTSKKCTKYKTQYQTEKGFYGIDFCINEKTEIAYIRTQTQTGEVFNEYADYNSMLIIERPVLPLLEYRIPIAGYATGTR